MIKVGTAVGLVMALSGVAAGASNCHTSIPNDQPIETPPAVVGVVEMITGPSVPLPNGKKCVLGAKKFTVRHYGDDGVAGMADPVSTWCVAADEANKYTENDHYPKG